MIIKNYSRSLYDKPTPLRQLMLIERANGFASRR